MNDDELDIDTENYMFILHGIWRICKGVHNPD